MNDLAITTPNKRKLTALYVRNTRPQPRPFLTWDSITQGLALMIRPNGKRIFKFVYSLHGRTRWYDLGDATAWPLERVRKRALELRLAVLNGKDPQGEKRAEATAGTFRQLVDVYFTQHAMKHNRSWKQARYLADKHLLPRWGTRKPIEIERAQVKALLREIEAKVVANQTLAVASAIFSWAIREEVGGVKVNPCSHVKPNKVEARSRVLSDSELPKFWAAFERAGLPGQALQLILLLGQRPGEVLHMRAEHLDGGWWSLPGAPEPARGWPGTKNGENHRVWLPGPAQAIVAEILGDRREGYVLGKSLRLDTAMREIGAELGIAEPVRPHDLRRTHGTWITRLGFGREAMNRVQNHKEGGIADVYDRHGYAAETKRIMERVAARILALAEGRNGDAKVVPMRAS
jgi:integrase